MKPDNARIVLLVILSVASLVTQAELRIEITEHIAGAQPIAVVPFAQDVRKPDEASRLDEVVRSDLDRSGWFRAVDPSRMLSQPSRGSDVDFRDWRLLGAEALVIGRISEYALGLFEVHFELYDVASGGRLTGSRFTGIGRSQLRGLAHHISDLIYQELTGIRGIFSTRIAYVTQENGRFQLHVSDVDGHNPITVLESVEPILSPAWSPDNQYLAYVSYQQGQAAIFSQHLASGNRDVITQFPGINGAPAWSPEGTQLALTLSKDGNPEIYLYRFADRRLQRLTNHFSIDTEPVWSPDGKSIIFTSDRSGGPQLYRVPVAGGNPQRLTFDGDYNARASLSDTGKRVAMVHGKKGSGYTIGVLELDSKRFDVLTTGSLDESPSFSPNGQMIH